MPESPTGRIWEVSGRGESKFNIGSEVLDWVSKSEAEGSAGWVIYMSPEPKSNHSVLMSGIFALIASMTLMVGRVRPLKILLKVAGDHGGNLQTLVGSCACPP